MENIDERIKTIICDASGYEWDDIKLADDLRADLGLDSLDIAKMEVDVEESLGIDVEPNAFSGVRTVQELITRLEDMVERRGVF